MDPCVLCFEDMNMLGFEDERLHTDTCVKLDCGHAYHTQCIIRCLSVSNLGCPSCNKYKLPSQELTREGMAKKLILELKKEDDIKFLVREFKESAEEYNQSIVQLKKDIKQFIEHRKQELHMSEKRKYMLDCLSKIQSTTKSVAKTKGPQYVGALFSQTGRYWRGTTFERIFFGPQYAYTICRLKSPRLYISLY